LSARRFAPCQHFSFGLLRRIEDKEDAPSSPRGVYPSVSRNPRREPIS
jgi:hypothetical protein